MLEQIPPNPFPNNKMLFGVVVAIIGGIIFIAIIRYCAKWSEDIDIGDKILNGSPAAQQSSHKP